MSSIDNNKNNFTIKWIICGTLESIYAVSELVLFSKYDLEFLTKSFVILDTICAVVKSLASFLFVATFHKKVSAYSIPIITAIVTHGVMVPILAYYTFSTMAKQGLNRDQIAIMFSKFIWFVYEIFFIYYLLKHWSKIQNSKIKSKRLENKKWSIRPSSKLDTKTKKMSDFEQNKLKVDEENLSPEEDQKKRYTQNQLYIQKCLQQNSKNSNQKLSINIGTQRNTLSLSQNESEIFRAKSKSIQSRGTNNSNQFDQPAVDDNKMSKKQKQLQFSEIFEPSKLVNKDEVEKNETKNKSKADNWDESEEDSATSIEKKSFLF